MILTVYWQLLILYRMKHDIETYEYISPKILFSKRVLTIPHTSLLFTLLTYIHSDE